MSTSVNVVTTLGKSVTCTFDPKISRKVECEGIVFLVVKISGNWRVLAPIDSSRYMLANKPYIYQKRNNAIQNVVDNVKILKQNISKCQDYLAGVNIKKEKEVEVVTTETVNITANIAIFNPTSNMSKFGHLLIWGGPESQLRDAKHITIAGHIFANEVDRRVEDMRSKNYLIRIYKVYNGEVNYKRKIKDFYEFCRSSRVIVREEEVK